MFSLIRIITAWLEKYAVLVQLWLWLTFTCIWDSLNCVMYVTGFRTSLLPHTIINNHILQFVCSRHGWSTNSVEYFCSSLTYIGTLTEILYSTNCGRFGSSWPIYQGLSANNFHPSWFAMQSSQFFSAKTFLGNNLPKFCTIWYAKVYSLWSSICELLLLMVTAQELSSSRINQFHIY